MEVVDGNGRIAQCMAAHVTKIGRIGQFANAHTVEHNDDKTIDVHDYSWKLHTEPQS